MFLITCGRQVILHFQGHRGRREIFFIMSKEFLFDCRISVKEGLDIETEKPHLEGFIDKTILRKCGLCSQLFIIPKNFKEDENTCNSCFKITSDIGKFGKMHVIWKDDSQYRVFTNLWRGFTQEIMNKEDLIDKNRYIDINKFNFKTMQGLDSF